MAAGLIENLIVQDPVCGARFPSTQAKQVYVYRDMTLYFDSADCLRRWLDDPEKFTQALQPPAEETS